ncbi:MAG: phosphatase PAP2 family protein [Candidatus Colwellbacteria bacterium]|nr:phosphatase PAP2 family protein [Candidatus Colwellbacteria bacterium]
MFAFERGISEVVFRFVNQAVFLKPLLVFCAEILPYIIIAVFIVKLFSIKSLKLRYHHLFTVSLGVLISRGLVAEVIGHFFRVARPFITLNLEPIINHPDTASFPSGHMSFLTPIAIMAIGMDKKMGYQLLGATIVCGISRMALGLHWPSDILGGIAVGLIGYIIADRLVPKKLS